MKRRGFLKLLVLGLGSVAILSIRRWNGGEDLPAASFFVAGVRFNTLSEDIAAGDRVEIKRESWRGERSYGIYAKNGERIGYVPRTLISSIDSPDNHNWLLESVDRHTVPWRQYKITRC
ncbi:MAG: hypothetical protein PHI29_00935 [Gallionella sp.]|nr:hypothetical protein [Gallionella sp.]